MINVVPSKEVNHVRGSGSSVWSGVIERLDSICQHTTAFVQDSLSELFLVFQRYRFMVCPSGIISKSFGVTVFVWLWPLQEWMYDAIPSIVVSTGVMNDT